MLNKYKKFNKWFKWLILVFIIQLLLPWQGINAISELIYQDNEIVSMNILEESETNVKWRTTVKATYGSAKVNSLVLRSDNGNLDDLKWWNNQAYEEAITITTNKTSFDQQINTYLTYLNEKESYLSSLETYNQGLADYQLAIDNAQWEYDNLVSVTSQKEAEVNAAYGSANDLLAQIDSVDSQIANLEEGADPTELNALLASLNEQYNAVMTTIQTYETEWNNLLSQENQASSNLVAVTAERDSYQANQPTDPYSDSKETLWKIAYKEGDRYLQMYLPQNQASYTFDWKLNFDAVHPDIKVESFVGVDQASYKSEYRVKEVVPAVTEADLEESKEVVEENEEENQDNSSEQNSEESQDEIEEVDETEDFATISFNLMEAPELEDLQVKVGEKLSLEEIDYINLHISRLEEEGYEFSHWTLDNVEDLDTFEAQLTNPFDFEEDITEDITLTAIWLVNLSEIDEGIHSVKFDLNGGESSPIIEEMEVKSGESLSEDQLAILDEVELTLEGHIFLYWTDEITDSEIIEDNTTDDELPKEYDFSLPITTDLTLYAVWSDDFYTVTFDSQNGTEVENLLIEKGKPVVTELAENTPVDNPANTVQVHSNVTELGVGVTEREGYDFAYWSVEAGEQLARLDVSTIQETDGPVITADNFNYGEPFNFTEPQFEDITLYAVWDNQAYNAETSAETQIITADTYTGPDSYESDNFNLLSMFNTQELTPGEIEVSKVATPVEGTVNTWDITLTLNGINYESDEKADIVIVLDTSGSMGDNRRLTNAKAAANQLIDIMAGNPNVRIGLVSFESGATVRHNLLSMNNPANVTALKNTISNFRANGGTHTQAGIRAGQSVLISDDDIADYMILLSDGEPTYSYRIINPENYLEPVRTNDLPENHRGAPSIGSNHIGPTVPQEAYTNQRVGTGNSIFQSFSYGSWPNRRTGYYNNANSARNEAGYAKATGTNIFSIGVDLDGFTNQILADIASPGNNYPAASSDLEAVFSDIGQTILTEAFGRNMVVTDPIGEGFTLIDGTIDVSQHSGTEPGYTFEDNTIRWEIGDSKGIENPKIFSAEMTYRVEINPDIVDVTNMVDDKLYLTNGPTSVTYTDIDETSQTVDFEVPLVDPLLLTIKKVVLDAYGNEVSATEEFTVDITNDSDFNQTFFLNVKNEFSTLSTDLRMNENYTITETGSNLDNYRTTITINNGDPVSGTSADFTVTGEYVEKTSSTGVSYDENQQDDIEIIITNQTSGIDVNFRKQDASTKEGLANVNFTLTPIDSNGVEGAAVEFTTGSSPAGSYQFESLDPGRYKLQEISPLEGYIAQTEPVYFELSIEDSTAVISLTDAGGSPIEYDFAFIEENQTIVIENMKPVEFNLRKVDGSDKDLALANIEFQIHDAAGNIVQSVNQEDLIAMTNSDGLASFTEFEPGTYYLVENETTLPANYQGLRAPLEFTIERDAENQISLTLINANDNDAQVITEEESILLEIYNYRKGEYPDTGGPGSLLYYLAGSILIIIAGSVYYLKFIRRRTF